MSWDEKLVNSCGGWGLLVLGLGVFGVTLALALALVWWL